jgi:hypothetical protein
MEEKKRIAVALSREKAGHTILGLLAAGSIWGFSEVVLGAVLKASGLPLRSAILTGVGLGIMGVAVSGLTASPALLGVVLVAVLCKQLVVPIQHVPFMCAANSSLAVLLEGSALTAVAATIRNNLDRRLVIRVGTGAFAALLAAGAFYFAGMRLAPCPYLRSFARRGGMGAFTLAEGLPWAVFSGVLFPVGYRLGESLRAFDTGRRQTRLYDGVSGALTVVCIAASALAFALGY